ncbi:peptidoglycan-binding protein [Nocardiopsis sp. FR26]|uniref:peptidoglycan-binding domain-containing protein n=1 Tax=Nocardiopsis sp. FR26 TaxID=2605987 RepID=UPI00135C019B|nr:peptidoglycan-binding domain-containing protein [Nocardiopsis sp. FR26]
MTTVVDTFDREVAGGWGTTQSGRTWLLTGGTNAERQVSGGAGRVTLADTPGTIRAQRLSRPWTDGEIFAQVTAGQTSETESLLVALFFRRDPANTSNFYRARVHLRVDGTVDLDVTRGTVAVGSRVSTGVTYTPGYRLAVRARVDGHRVRARVWPVGAAEPTTWQVDQTITTDPILTGDMGVMVSAFANNTNTAPWVEFRRIEVTYRLLVENPLTGATGTQVSNASLAATAKAGTVTIGAAGARATYSTTQTVWGNPTVQVASGHHRAETPRLRLTLPTSGRWSARFYTWMPALQDAGHGTNEVRSVAVLPEYAWVVHATTAGNVGARLQLPDLAATPLSWATETGTAVATARWWRVELQWDGASVFTSRVYPGHETATSRVHTWTGMSDLGRTLDVTGFRWRRRTTLRWGDQGSEVTALQNELVDLGYDIGPWGADGDYGNATYNAVVAFQGDYGVAPADGVAGPETRAAMDLALGRVPPPLYLSHVAVADGELIGPVEPPPPDPVQRRGRLVLGMRI